jgi:DNA-binding NtrC family response regulator
LPSDSFKSFQAQFDMTLGQVFHQKASSGMSAARRPVLLVVSDDNGLVRQVAKMTSERCELIVARSLFRMSAILNSGNLIDAVIIARTGDRVPSIVVLGVVRGKQPQARSILLGDSTNLAASVEALHAGLADHVINPPLRERELLAILAMPAPRPALPEPSVEVMAQQKRPV